MSTSSRRARAARAGALMAWRAWLAGGIALCLAGGVLIGCEAGSTTEQAQAAEKAVPAELQDGCKAVAERLVALTQESLVRLPDRERALVDSQLGQVRDQYAARCMEDAWSAQVLACMRAAATREAFAQCAPAPGR